jgi:antitoxin (DNA-binding transcriptional repressor) of toxin-antitoxin stability system
MTIITIELDQFRDHLDQSLAAAEQGDVIVTRGGEPWIVVRAVTRTRDAEDHAEVPEFWEMIQQRRSEPGIPWDEAKRQLDLD